MQSHQAFGPHCDTHDVFAIHFEGEKVWNIYEKTENNPINHPLFKYTLKKELKKQDELLIKSHLSQAIYYIYLGDNIMML